MFKYKSEVLKVQRESKGLSIVKSILSLIDTEQLDELLNKQSEDGWELVTHSFVVDPVGGGFRVIVTFRKSV